ncbi:EF-hand-like domain protein [Metarhizium album ARSEF 1941]|uniref:EF-hand-like domain protein n=1 Tax=Metarhizium album (strain ARSEF 1941) TaxID=1081103 RepID=A0A0B2WUB0_METAS|nr:EF-hand-like domain protein [Metarhizium album ARSEF 1941]KHN99661.1 EF-hand-like domain protein [Metarhizium album ARSEF 1941]
MSRGHAPRIRLATFTQFALPSTGVPSITIAFAIYNTKQWCDQDCFSGYTIAVCAADYAYDYDYDSEQQPDAAYSLIGHNDDRIASQVISAGGKRVCITAAWERKRIITATTSPVNREDVADMLSQLGLPNGAPDVSKFFPPSKPQTIALAAFLNSLAETLCQLSPSTELLSAFSAFDNDDSGQVDWAELRDALLNTAPEPGERVLTAAEVDRVVNGFTGRRAFNRNISAQLGAKKGEVFKYNEFVNSIMGSNGTSEGSPQENIEEQ